MVLTKCLLLAFVVLVHSQNVQRHLCEHIFQEEPLFEIGWTVSSDETQIFFTLEADTIAFTGWLGFGISPVIPGEMEGSNAVVYSPGADSIVEYNLQSSTNFPPGMIEAQLNQDLIDTWVEVEANLTIVHFTMNVDGDADSLPIDISAETGVIAAVGPAAQDFEDSFAAFHAIRWQSQIHFGNENCTLGVVPTAPPVTDPPVEETDPPVTEPPVTEPPVTDPPADCGQASADLFSHFVPDACVGYVSGDFCENWTCDDPTLEAIGNPYCDEGVWEQNGANCIPPDCATVGTPQHVGDSYCDWDHTPGGNLIHNSAECNWDMGDCCASTCQGPDCGVNGYHCLDPDAKDRDCAEFELGAADQKNTGTIILELDLRLVLEEDCEALCCGDENCVSYNWFEATHHCELLSDVTGTVDEVGWVSGDHNGDICVAEFDGPWDDFFLLDFACFDGTRYTDRFDAEQACCECDGCTGLVEKDGVFTIRSGEELRRSKFGEKVYRINPPTQASCVFEDPVPDTFLFGHGCGGDGRRYHTELEAMEKCCGCADCAGVTCDMNGDCTVRSGDILKRSTQGETTTMKERPDPTCSFGSELQNVFIPGYACTETRYQTLRDAERACCECVECLGITRHGTLGYYTTREGGTQQLPRGSRSQESSWLQL